MLVRCVGQSVGLQILLIDQFYLLNNFIYLFYFILYSGKIIISPDVL